MQNQDARRRELYALLGDLPPRDYAISAETVSTVDTGKYVLETLSLDLNGIEVVPAYFARPRGGSGALPAVVFNHSHGGNYHIGKQEFPRGAAYMNCPPYAEQLTSMGCCALAIDHWNFGERRGRTESELFKEMLWHGRVLWGMMVYDSIRAVDYLTSRADVDAARLGTIGMSMGSTMGWWLAALDVRITVCVDICCLTDFEAIIKSRGLDGHGIYYYVPSLLKHFTTTDINALIAPRAHLSLNGNYDRLTPPEGLDRVDAGLKRVYAEAGAPDAWKMLRYDIGHIETALMRREIVGFLGRHLTLDA